MDHNWTSPSGTVPPSPQAAAPPRPVNLDNTSRCPTPARCEACGSTSGVTTVTLETAVGVLCGRVCDECLDAGRLPHIAGWVLAAERVIAHCEHLGCDLDQMTDILAAERRERPA